MNRSDFEPLLREIEGIDGIDGGAIVDVESGMPWCVSAGIAAEGDLLAEAASDYWRMYQRLARNFESLGELRASLLVHSNGRLTLLPCGPGLIAVIKSTQQNGIDWIALQKRVMDIGSLFSS